MIDLDTLQASVRVPNECVYSDDNGSYVFIVDKDSGVKKSYVITGIKDGSHTAIMSGVEGGAHIVYDPAAREHEDEEIREIIR